MKPALVRFPVVCPECGVECLTAFAIAELAASLINEDAVMLQSPCHQCTWPANANERDQIRQYLGALAAQR
jgi:hypothetical protein